MQKARLMRRALQLPLPIAVLAVFSGVAFVNFYRLNLDSLVGPSRLIVCYLMVLVAAIVILLIAKAVFRDIPIARIFLVAAVATFMAFHYTGIKRLVGGDRPALSIACWACVTVLLAYVVGKFSGRKAFLPTMAIVGMIYMVPAVTGLIRARLHYSPPAKPVALPLTARNASNVYWIVLDGYPRADVLKEFFDFDDTPFLNGLRDLDFVVYDHAVASFPETAFSISSTLSLGPLVDETGSPTKIPSISDLSGRVRGRNVVVATMRAMGYRYIHFQNGYDDLTQCPLEGAVCIRGNVGHWLQFDEFDLALLSMTPLIDAIALGNAKLKIDETPFARGAVSDLTDRLADVQASGGPFFLYGHVLAPHPPIRFRRDCSLRPADMDLQRWDAREKPAFLEQLACVNREAIDLVGKIVDSDPQAIVVVQSDHGTAFRGQFQPLHDEPEIQAGHGDAISSQLKKPYDAWDALDVKERFGALNAMRMPAVCAEDTAGSVDLVNTFARVLSCISGHRLPDKAARLFVVSHDGDMTDVHEYKRDF
jgi:hypothetical protein